MAKETQKLSPEAAKRQRMSSGITLLVIGILMFLLFTRGTKPGQLATFGMNLGSSQAKGG